MWSFSMASLSGIMLSIFWITRHAIGKADTVPLVEEPIEGDMQSIDQQAMQDYINAIRSVSWWRAKYGAMLDAAKLEGRE